MQRFTVIRQVDVGIAVDQSVRLEPGEKLARGFGIQRRRPLEVMAELLTGQPRPAGSDELEGILGLGLDSALGEVLAQGSGQQ
jgi:hypothetical protein